MSVAPLHFIDAGAGPAVVLVHAIGCDLRMWDELAADLVANGMRVVRVDVRGHGASPVPERPYSLAELAGDVAAVLDRCGVARAHWVGLSMGGMIGQAFAIERGERLARLVLANTTSSYGADGRKMWEARAKAVEDGGMAAITDLAMTRYFSDEFRARRADVVERVRARFLETNP
ncbi:MAG TPA: alpha/beta fold hydrolase, partial [Usitatibacter sp.]